MNFIFFGFILIVGDSVSMGTGIPYEKNVQYYLETKLPMYCVNSIGGIGFNTVTIAQQLLSEDHVFHWLVYISYRGHMHPAYLDKMLEKYPNSNIIIVPFIRSDNYYQNRIIPFLEYAKNGNRVWCIDVFDFGLSPEEAYVPNDDMHFSESLSQLIGKEIVKTISGKQ